jgi:hypothetical protein
MAPTVRKPALILALVAAVSSHAAQAQQPPYTKVQLLGFPVMTGYDSFVAPNGLLYFSDNLGAYDVGAYTGSLDKATDLEGSLSILVEGTRQIKRGAIIA